MKVRSVSTAGKLYEHGQVLASLVYFANEQR